MQTKAKAPRARKAAPVAAPVAPVAAPAPSTALTVTPAPAAPSKADLRDIAASGRAADILACRNFLRAIDPGRASVPFKALSDFKSAYLRELSGKSNCRKPSQRQSAALAAAAIASGVKLADGAIIPRRSTIADDNGAPVPAAVENGCSDDTRAVGLTTYSAESECFTLRPGALAIICAIIGAPVLREHGAI